MSNTEYKKTVTGNNAVSASDLNFDVKGLETYKGKTKDVFKSTVTNSISTTLDLSIFLDEEKLNKSISQTSAVEHMNFEVNNDVLKQDYPSQIESTSTTNTVVETLEDVPMQKYH